MNSLAISIISKQMESMSMTNRVVRGRNKVLSFRYSPYSSGNNFSKVKEKQKEETVRQGIELSLLMAEAMFLLSDDIRFMLCFGFWLFKIHGKENLNSTVFGRLFRVFEYVFETYIKPKNGVYKDGGKSIQSKQFKRSCRYFGSGVRAFDSIVSNLKSGVDVVKPSDFVCCNKELKTLEQNLRSVRDVSVANGFAKEAIESNILHLWNSLFETTPEVMDTKARYVELFKPVLREYDRYVCYRRLSDSFADLLI